MAVELEPEVKVLIDVLDDLGIAPQSDAETVTDLLAELKARGWALTRIVSADAQRDDAPDE